MTKLNLSENELETLANTAFAQDNEYTFEDLKKYDEVVANVLSGATDEIGFTEHRYRRFDDELGNRVEVLKIVEFSKKFFFTRIGDSDSIEQGTLFEMVEEYNNHVGVLEEEAEIIAGL